MGKKDTFLQELLAQTLQPVVIGDVAKVEVPTTKDDAIIAIAKCAVNANNALLRKMSGLDLTELVMQSGSRNPILVAALLSRLEVIAGVGGKLKIVSPADGSKTANPFAEFACSGNGITKATCSADGSDVALSQSGDTWSGHPSSPLAIGKHRATFAATFGDESTAEESVEFEISAELDLVSTFPKHETTLKPNELDRIEIELSEEAAAENQSISVEVFDQTITMTGTGTKYVKSLVEIGVIAADWQKLNVMTVYNAAKKVIGTVSFILSDEGGGE